MTITDGCIIGLPGLLIVAAVMSQFSAAVADTAGGGGLMAENTGDRLDPKRSYLVMTIVAVVLTWFADIFQIISIASRAFAFYYLLQTVIAWLICGTIETGSKSVPLKIFFALVTVVLTFVVIFGHSAE